MKQLQYVAFAGALGLLLDQSTHHHCSFGLSRLQDPISRSLAPKLGVLLKRSDVLEGAKASLREQIGRYDAEGALHAIQQMDVSESQKQLLRAYISVYHGRFELARHQLDVLQVTQPEHEKEWVSVRTFVDQSALEFRVYSERLSWLRQHFDYQWVTGGNLAYAPAGLQEFRDNAISLLLTAKNGVVHHDTRSASDKREQDAFRYTFDAISRVANVAPLNEESLEWIFQAALFTKPYAAVERLGDRILAGQGRLMIPITASEGHFVLVIDKKERRLVLAPVGRLTPSSLPISNTEHAAPFDISFDQVNHAQQNVKFKTSTLGESLCWNARVFEIESPNVTITTLPFLVSFGTLYGELATRQVIWDFGKFLTHVIDRPQLKAELIKQEAGGSGWSFASVLLAAGAVGSSITGNAAQTATLMNGLNQIDSENQARNLQQQQQLQAWEGLAANTSFDLIEKDLFREFEGVLTELQ
jgi:hypothetical protein